MGIGSLLYRSVFRRASSVAVVMVGGALFYERGLDMMADLIFDNLNKGRQWKDIKHKYEQ